MGQDPNLGDYYAVQIGFWSSETLNPLPPPSGSNVLLVVMTQAAGHYATNYVTNFVVGDRGYVQRIDFGAGPATGLHGFAAWAANWGLGDGGRDDDGDGASNYNEYVAGTNPMDASSAFRLGVAPSGTGNLVAVTFEALQAEGVGYEGLTRYYSLETTTNATLNAWAPVEGCTNIAGDNKIFTHFVSTTDSAPAFYRGRLELRNP
jgi:hypothetical protein